MTHDASHDRLLGHMLVSAGLLKKEQLEEAMAAVAATPGSGLQDELLKRGWVTQETLDRATEASIQGAPSMSSAPQPTSPHPPPTVSTIYPAPNSASVSPSQAPTVGNDPSRTETASLHDDPSRQVEEEKKYPAEVTQAAAIPKNRFGKYILVRQLGHGGMAVVYKAWDTFLNHFVALKFIKTQDIADAGSQEQIDQFMAEARLAVKLNHPNIARVYELGKHEDKFYMAQFYIDGPTLHEVIHGTRSKSMDTLFYQDPQRFVRIMRDLADAMTYAHGLTPPIIHRDLKPSNVLLDAAGKAYVVDFGLAKELKVDGGSMSGAVKGTPKYMAPEQAEGRSKDMDGRTDIWALGVILYETLTGRAPFEDENIHRLLSKIVNDDPPLPRHVVSSRTAKLSPSSAGMISIPRDLEVIALRCLQKDRRHRYPTAKEMVEDLDRVLGGQKIETPDLSVFYFMGKIRRVMRKHRWTILPVFILLAILIGISIRQWRTPPEPVKSTAVVVPFTEVPEARRREVARIRDAFLAEPSVGTLQPLVGLLGSIEPVMGPVARQGLGDWWAGYVSTREAETAAIHGSGKPQKSWLAEGIRARAQALLTELDFAAQVNRQHKLLGLTEKDLMAPLASLRVVLDWKGTFTLAANVHPWASVRVRINGKEHGVNASQQEDITPVRYAELPVGKVQVEFVRGSERKAIEVTAADLRDGSVLRVWGSLEKLEQAIE